MSGVQLGGAVIMLLLSTAITVFSIYETIRQRRDGDRPFAGYQSLQDCISQNQDKRNPEQYCRRVKYKVERARAKKRERQQQ